MSWDGELCWDGGAGIRSVPGKHVWGCPWVGVPVGGGVVGLRCYLNTSRGSKRVDIL